MHEAERSPICQRDVSYELPILEGFLIEIITSPSDETQGKMGRASQAKLPFGIPRDKKLEGSVVNPANLLSPLISITVLFQ
jgi:hypothetical protein